MTFDDVLGDRRFFRCEGCGLTRLLTALPGRPKLCDECRAGHKDRPKPLVYVAGPYSKPDPVENTHHAIRAGMALWETGKCAVLIPHLSLLAHIVQPRGLDYWYELDLDQLAHCDALYRLPGASSGADKEVAFAVSREIPVFRERAELLDWLEAP